MFTIGHQGASDPQPSLIANAQIWFVHHKLTESATPRHWNVFGLTRNLDESASNAIVVEINIPLSGYSRKVAGLFARDEKGRIFLLHSGKIGGGRKGIGATNFLKWYKRKKVEYTVPDNENAQGSALEIANLNATDTDVVTSIADFIGAVYRFKTRSAPAISERDLEQKATSTRKPRSKKAETTTYVRNPHVVAYVKKRANGKCELCRKKAPFEDSDGKPYLECHHITWLAQGGIDTRTNAVALCPNCHRKMHICALNKDIETLKSKALG